MADEAVRLLQVNPSGFYRTQKVTVADANALTRGTIMVWSADPYVAVAHSGADQLPAGILLEDKVANDSKTSVAVAIDGVWDITAVGNITLGDMVTLSATANRVQTCPGSNFSLALLSRILGQCLETASAAEVVRVKLMLG